MNDSTLYERKKRDLLIEMTTNNGKKDSPVIFRLPGLWLAWWVVPLPLFALVCCVVLSLLYNFKESTATHCRVPNYLPSISSAIGGYTPQRYIWRICIALHCAPRFMIAIMYYNHYMSFPAASNRCYQFMAAINSILHLIENAALVVLSMVSSTEDYPIHEKSFVSFMVCSEVYMLLTCILYKWSRGSEPLTARDKKSFQYKVGLFLFNVTCFLLAVYFFFRHNNHCEQGAYTKFAFLEYATVTSNIGFHGYTLVYDFGGSMLKIKDAEKHGYYQL